MALLELKNIKKYYASQKAVDDVSFSIAHKSIFGLLGPNGAGKTTLLRMITGIFYADSGSILLDGKVFNPEKDLSYIGYMPEERGLYKKMKVGEQALYLAQLKGLTLSEAKERVRFWFTRLDMQSWWDKKIEDLSKGMSQKLQFVTTVLHEPKLIILDEPFSGLDPVNANLIKDEIFELAQNGSTIIFSTHRMEQVEEICDHIILMNKGQKILDGTIDSVKQEFKEGLLELSFSKAYPEYTSHPQLFDILSRKEKSIVVQAKGGIGNNELLQFFIQQGYELSSFKEILPSLNDIFIHIVEGTPAARQFTR